MCRYEQEQVQKSTTRSQKIKNIRDDEKHKIVKSRYVQVQAFHAYQKVLKPISHRYLYVIKNAIDSSDEDRVIIVLSINVYFISRLLITQVGTFENAMKMKPM